MSAAKSGRTVIGFEEIVGSPSQLLEVRTVGSGPAGRLPLTPEMLLDWPSGDVFGWTQNAGMGWDPRELGRPQFLILSTQGGIRAPDGQPVALGYHTGHWEVGLLMEAAAGELRRLECLPFAGFVTDPCENLKRRVSTGKRERSENGLRETETSQTPKTQMRAHPSVSGRTRWWSTAVTAFPRAGRGGG